MEDTTKIEQGARLSQVFDRLGLSQIAVSQLTGISQPLLSQVCSGRRGLTRRVEVAIAEKLPDVNMRWVLSGTGEMFYSDTEKKNRSLVEDSGKVVYDPDPLASLRRLLDEHERRLEALEEIVQEMKQLQP